MSEILNEFAKIGFERGWIVKGEEKKDLKKDNLYNIKVDDIELLEKAHPEENLVVLRTHVPNNGMVHKLKQKQDIAIDIANRTPLGNYQQHFYIEAYQNLINKTIKLAFFLDDEKNIDLSKLADTCCEQLQKRAAWPLVVGIIAGVSALYGGLYSSNNPTAQGIKQDTMRALSKIQELFEEDQKSIQILDPLKKSLEKLLHFATSFYQYNDEILSTMLKITGTDSADDKRKAIALNVKNLLEGPKHEQIIKDFNEFKKICQETLRMIPLAIQYLSNAENQNRDPENSTWHFLKKVIRDYVYNSDYQDLIKILNNLQEDIAQVPSNIEQQLSKLNELKSKTQTLPEDLKDVMPAV